MKHDANCIPALHFRVVTPLHDAVVAALGALFAIALLQAAAVAEASAPAITLAPCELPDVRRPAQCGSLEVPENSKRPDGRRISLGVAVVPAATQPALPDPIVVLMGGPGEDAISAASVFVAQFEPLLRDRDLLLVDQRGTGRSNALNCDLLAGAPADTPLHDVFPLASAQRCEQELASRADLTQYTVVQYADDLEAVRHALGYGALNLSAGSYGTRSAQQYLRAYPRSVRTAHLGSVVPIDIAPALTMAKSAQAALENTFAACARDAACHAAYPDLPDEFRALIERLDAGQALVSVAGLPDKVKLDRGRTAEWFRAQLYRPATAANVPWLIHRAFLGDWQPIADGILAHGRALHTALNIGVFFSVTCSEDLAFVRDADVERESRGTFLGDYRVRQQLAVCRTWPKAALPAGHRTPVKSTVPTLFISGDTDSASPPWFTEHVARGFANRAELVLQGLGHTEWSDCVPGVYEQFVRSGSAQGLDTAACTPTPRPAFRTSHLETTLRFDYGGAEAMIATLKRPHITAAEARALMKVDSIDALIRKMQVFFPGGNELGWDASPDGFVRAVLSAVNEETFRRGPYRLDSVRVRSREVAELIGILKRQEEDLRTTVLGRLAPFAPAGAPHEAVVFFVAGGSSDGFVLDDDPRAALYVKLDKPGADADGVIEDVTHELYHVLQKASGRRNPRYAAFVGNFDARPAVHRLLATTLWEGSANLAVDAREARGCSAYIAQTRGFYERNLQPEQLRRNFELFDRTVLALASGTLGWERAYDAGFSFDADQPFYFVGMEMARALRAAHGPAYFDELFTRAPSQFFVDYLAAAERDPQLPQFSADSKELLYDLAPTW